MSTLVSSKTFPACTFHVCGAPLRISFTEAPLRRCTETVLRHKGIVPADRPSPPAESDARMVVERSARPPHVPAQSESLGRYDESSIDIVRCSDSLFFLGPGIWAHVNVERRTSQVVVAPSVEIREPRGPTRAFTHVIGFVLVGLLQARSWYPLHAAVLARNGRGLVLLAESDAGKSTTAFQLVRNGWSYVSDDNVLLRRSPLGIEAVSLRPEFCLDADAAIHFPELRTHPWPRMVGDEVKWRVDPQRLYPGRFVSSCLPRALVLPSIVDVPASSVTPAPATDLLPPLLQQSGFSLSIGSERSAQHFRLLGQFLRQCTTYRLCSGRDGLDDGRALDRLLRPLIAPVPASSAD